VSNELRQVIWPKLLGVNRFDLLSYRDYVRRNRWSDQITRDVDRSLWHYQLPPTKKRKRGSRRRLLEDVSDLDKKALLAMEGLRSTSGWIRSTAPWFFIFHFSSFVSHLASILKNNKLTIIPPYRKNTHKNIYTHTFQ
jgi:hypothetical protein